MKKDFFLLLFCIAAFLPACSQQDTVDVPSPIVTEHKLSVGETRVNLRLVLFENQHPFLLVQLHGNELTAATAAMEAATRWGIPFLQLPNHGKRLVSFRLAGNNYQFDPNRIFSDEGIKKTLTLSGRYSAAAFLAVHRFRDSLLGLFPEGKPVVSVHNNTNGRFNLLQYKKNSPGATHVNPGQDEDDFFITNDSTVFQLLKKEDMNVVLEDATKMEEDGSLSLYCSRTAIRYINIETEHGHLNQQAAMLAVIRRVLK